MAIKALIAIFPALKAVFVENFMSEYLELYLL